MALREINLIPSELLRKKYLLHMLLFWAGCLTCVLSLILGFYLYQVNIVLPRKRPVTTIEDMHKQLGATLAEIQETQQEIQRLSNQESFLKSLTRTPPFSTILFNLSAIMNGRTWLDGLTIRVDTEEGKTLPDMELSGYSWSNDDLGNFMTQLSGDPMFSDVVLKYAKEAPMKQSKQDGKFLQKHIQFQIECKIPTL